MKWLERAERKFGHLAVPHLMRIIVAFSALVFVLYKLNPYWIGQLTLDPAAVMRGEVWRLVSYIFIPAIGSPIADWLFALLYLYWMWWIGDGIEEAMGSFRVNVFYLIGMIGTTIAAFFFGAGFSSAMLNASVFYAFARFYPDMVIYLMMIVPVKVRWMAWVSGVFLLIGFVAGDWSYRAAVVVAFANYLIFFGKEIFQDATMRRETAARRRKFVAAALPEDEALHRCEVCGRSENDAPELEFRVARDGHEYCKEHLPKVG